tara:strand:+ start:2652 stop:3272 length:621 start_codon:yes stop_codon:yes gene_type:complete
MSAKQVSQKNYFQENSNPNNGVSLCIPRVFPNFKWHDVKKAMVETGMGFVERVDLIPVWKDGKVIYKRAYIHFKAKKWNMRTHRQTLSHLQNGGHVEIMYDEPWFWKASISNVKRPAEGPKAKDAKVKVSMIPRVKRKKRLDLDEGEIAEDKTGVVGEDPIASRQAEVAYRDGYVPDGTGGFVAKEWATDEQVANRVENWKKLSSM